MGAQEVKFFSGAALEKAWSWRGDAWRKLLFDSLPEAIQLGVPDHSWCAI